MNEPDDSPAARYRRADEHAQRLARAFRSTFTDPATGRPHLNAGPVLRHLAEFAGFMARSRLTPGHVDAIGLAVIEGRRQMLVEILRQAGIDPLEHCPSFD